MTTQKDIARELGVSVSLVSRALSGQAAAIGASDETVRQICETAAAMGYVPSAAARSLKGLPSRTIGVVVYDFEDPFFGPIIGHLQHLAHTHSYSLVLTGFERRQVRTSDLGPLLKHNLDGLIVIGSEDAGDWAEQFLDRKVPVIQLGSSPLEDRLTHVAIDERRGFDLALSHLMKTGRDKIGFVGASGGVHSRRAQLFRELMSELGLSCYDHWIERGEAPSIEAGNQACIALLDASEEEIPNAIVASNDVVAIGVIRALFSRGIRTPSDVAVSGFDDIPLAAACIPSLTTVRQPITTLVKKAFDLVTGEDKAWGDHLFSPELVIRESA